MNHPLETVVPRLPSFRQNEDLNINLDLGKMQVQYLPSLDNEQV